MEDGPLAQFREPLPAWGLPADARDEIALPPGALGQVDRDWAWGGSRGAGVRVCILDSGVERDHPKVGPLARAVWVACEKGNVTGVEEDTEGDLAGHGTACAGIVRSIAPECELVSVRVLGAGNTGSGAALLGGLRWAIKEGYEVINMSLSTTKKDMAATLREITDQAFFRRSVLVASAHNMAVESFPWRFSSVISVGSHEETDALEYFYNPEPPVEFFARGVDVEVAWSSGRMIRSTGNSMATAHISGICALILSKHPGLTPFELKSVLRHTASNIGRAA